ncbi:TPA: hypothetical protein DDW35_02710 [Candidatus Sumerlaeota bacterium]|nr:hypothetical protein [Candidatus Sumerlaeota bacterium]
MQTPLYTLKSVGVFTLGGLLLLCGCRAKQADTYLQPGSGKENKAATVARPATNATTATLETTAKADYDKSLDAWVQQSKGMPSDNKAVSSQSVVSSPASDTAGKENKKDNSDKALDSWVQNTKGANEQTVVKSEEKPAVKPTETPAPIDEKKAALDAAVKGKKAKAALEKSMQAAAAERKAKEREELRKTKEAELLDKSKPQPVYNIKMNTVKMVDKKLGKLIAMVTNAAKFNPARQLAVYVVFRNFSDKTILIEGQLRFYDGTQRPFGEPTKWKQIFIEPHTTVMWEDCSIEPIFKEGYDHEMKSDPENSKPRIAAYYTGEFRFGEEKIED